jgi:hypothetical protein
MVATSSGQPRISSKRGQQVRSQKHGSSYSAEEDQWLIDHYNVDMTPDQCAAHLGRTRAATEMEVAKLRKEGRPVAYARHKRQVDQATTVAPEAPEETVMRMDNAGALKQEGPEIAPERPRVGFLAMTEGEVEQAPMPDRETCIHFRIVGHTRIMDVFPEFYKSYAKAPDWAQWEICIRCGDTQMQPLRKEKIGGPDVPNMRPIKYTRVYVPVRVRALAEEMVSAAKSASVGRVADGKVTRLSDGWRKYEKAEAEANDVAIQGGNLAVQPAAELPTQAEQPAEPAPEPESIDEGEIARIAVEIKAVDPEASAAAIDAEAREWGNWEDHR